MSFFNFNRQPKSKQETAKETAEEVFNRIDKSKILDRYIKGKGDNLFLKQRLEDPDIRGKLENKLEEYKKRLQDSNFNNNGNILKDTYYKIEILKNLLDFNELDAEVIILSLEKKFGKIDLETLKNSLGVIESYALDGGKDVKGGTGI